MDKVYSLYQAEDWFRNNTSAVICVFGEEEKVCHTRDEMVDFYEKKDIRLCSCCGQPRPYPTEPGIWEFCQDPLIYGNKPAHWTRVQVSRHPEGMTITPLEGEHKGECIWWPDNAKWRKVS